MSEEITAADDIKIEEAPKVEKPVAENKPEEQAENPVNGSCNGPEEEMKETMVGDSVTEQENKEEQKEPDQVEKEPDQVEKEPDQVEKEPEEEKPEPQQEEAKVDEPEIKQSEEKMEIEQQEKAEKPEETQSETKPDTEKPEDAQVKQSEKQKKETKTDEEEDDDEDDESSDEELPPGLLERPVEILKEKRERKKTSRFTYDDIPTPSSEKKKLEIPEGRGVKLIEHPRVEWQLNRNKIEDLKIIHKLFFGVFGDQTCKKNMKQFSGFPFEKDSPEFEKKEDYLGRFTLDNLKWALTVCDVEPRNGKKEDLMDRFLEWCLCPKPTGKPLPQKKAKKEKTAKKKKKKKAKKTSEKSDKSLNDTSITSDDISSDDSDSEAEEVTPKKPKQTKKTPKKQTPKQKAAPKKKGTPKSPKKRKATASPKKIAKVKIGSPKKSDEADSDDGDAPLSKKAKKAPTNAQIRKDVANILKGADLEVITMKAVCVKVYSLYPDFDLSEKKAFIKETVKAIIS